MSVATEKATFGAGCFWGVEAAFRQVPESPPPRWVIWAGISRIPPIATFARTRPGTRKWWRLHSTRRKFPTRILLKVFWENHDPTQFNRQGPDYGTQYRTAIFFHSPEQEAAARASKEALDKSGKYKRRIVTEITPAAEFWRAEEYHQQYLEKRGLASCHIK